MSGLRSFHGLVSGDATKVTRLKSLVEVAGLEGYGFAAGCAAVATPRRQRQIVFRATPLVRIHRFRFLGLRPHQGRSPKCKRNSTAGHSHRRTSDGKAELEEAHAL